MFVCLVWCVAREYRQNKSQRLMPHSNCSLILIHAYCTALEAIKANLPWECCSCGVSPCQAVEVTALAEPSTAELQKGQSLARFCLRKGPASRWRDGLRLWPAVSQHCGSSLIQPGVQLLARASESQGWKNLPPQELTSYGWRKLKEEDSKIMLSI